MLDTLPKFLLFHVMSFLFSWEDPDPRLSLDTDAAYFGNRQEIPGRKCFCIAGISKYFHGIVHSQEYWHDLMLFCGLNRKAALYQSCCAFFCPTMFDPAITIRYCDAWNRRQMTFISTLEPVILSDKCSLNQLNNHGLQLFFQFEGKLYFFGHVRMFMHDKNRVQMRGFFECTIEQPDEIRAMLACKRLLRLPSCILLANFWTGVVFVTDEIPKTLNHRHVLRQLYKGQVLRATEHPDETLDQLDQDHVYAKLLQRPD